MFKIVREFFYGKDSNYESPIPEPVKEQNEQSELYSNINRCSTPIGELAVDMLKNPRLYRIRDECVYNMTAHSSKSEVTIRCKRTRVDVKLKISRGRGHSLARLEGFELDENEKWVVHSVMKKHESAVVGRFDRVKKSREDRARKALAAKMGL